MWGEVMLRQYGVKDGQRCGADLPITVEALRDVSVRAYVRDELARDAAHLGIPFPDDPVVLCWLAYPTHLEPADQPLVWAAWDDPTPPYPSWIDSADAHALVLDRPDALRAAEAWPTPTWWHHWHPTAAWRQAAREKGITAVLVGGPANGRHLRAPRHQTVELPTTGPRGWASVLYHRDPEPSGLADDGTALWTYRHEVTP